jgi:hypothetical protein
MATVFLSQYKELTRLEGSILMLRRLSARQKWQARAKVDEVAAAAVAVEDLAGAAVVDHGVDEVVAIGIPEVATTAVDGEVSIVLFSGLK